MYDLKTVHGKSSVDTQLLDSIGQANRILLNMTSDYNPRTLAKIYVAISNGMPMP